MTQALRYLSVCSGIEAATVAWHPLGWSPVAFAEIDKFPCAVLAHHYPAVPNWGDLTKYREWPDATIDLLVGGTPCQSFSVAGLRKGLADPRGNLALTFLAVADRYRPRWLVWENVPGVLSADDGRAFGSLLGGLAELGYGFAYRILDAQYFGLAQRRARVFVVGHLGDWRRAAAVLFERESLSGHPAPSRETGKGTTRGVEIGPSGGRFTELNPTIDARATDGPIRNQLAGAVMAPPSIPCAECEEPEICRGCIGQCARWEIAELERRAGGRGVERTGESRGQDCVIPIAGERARALTASSQRLDSETETFIVHALRADGFDASEDGTGRGTPIVTTLAIRGRGDSSDLETRTDGTANAILTPNGGRGGIGVGAIAFSVKDYGADAGDLAPTLWAGGHDASHANGGCMPAVAMPLRAGRQYSDVGDGQSNIVPVAFANTSGDTALGMSKPGVPPITGRNGDPGNVLLGMQVRRLTPRECERLQGFPDDYTLIPYRGKPAADGPRYKALGNSMAVPVMRWIGERIQLVECLTVDREGAV